MARVPFSGQSRYTDQLLQSVLIPTIVSNSLNGKDFYTIETDLCAKTVHVETLYATEVYGIDGKTMGDLVSETVSVGCQSLQGVYTSCVSTTVVGVRAAGNSNARGTFNGNVLIGAETGLNMCNTNFSTYIGAGAGTFGQATSNVVVGYGACTSVSANPTRGNVILGAGAGLTNTGDSNVFIGLNVGATSTVSNTLIIHNSSISAHPLLHGKFDSQQLGVNCVPICNFQVSGNAFITRDLSVGRTTTTLSLGVNCTPTRTFHVSGNSLLAGELSVSRLISTPSLGVNCTPTTTFQVAGDSVLSRDLSVGRITTTLCLGVNCIPTQTFEVLGNTRLTGDLSVGGIISGFMNASNISGFAADLHGGGNGDYGGVGLYDSTISLGGSINNVATTNNFIGGVYLENSNISFGGSLTNFDTTFNYVGGVYLENSNISFGGTISNVGYTTNYIGGVYLENSNISFGGTIRNPTATYNSIGGVTLSSGYILGDGSLLSNLPISGTLSNIIINPSNSSNSIGGVSLCNGYVVGDGSLLTNLPMISGTLSNIIINPSNSSNSIGGVSLCNGYVVGDGSLLTNLPMISGTLSNIIINPSNSSNSIGGVTLSSSSLYGFNRVGTVSGGAAYPMITNSTDDTGMYFVNYTDQTRSALLFRTLCDGVAKSAFTIDYRGNLGVYGYIANSNNTSNSIGGVSLESGNVVIPKDCGLTVGSNSTTTRGELQQYGVLFFDNSNSSLRYSLGPATGGLYLANSTGSTLTIAAATGNISNVSSSSNNIGGVVLSSGALTISVNTLQTGYVPPTTYSSITVSTYGLYVIYLDANGIIFSGMCEFTDTGVGNGGVWASDLGSATTSTNRVVRVSANRPGVGIYYRIFRLFRY